MDRKKTIVAAAMINAGILTALFITAMMTQNEQEPSVSLISEIEKNGAELKQFKSQPLYAEIGEVNSKEGTSFQIVTPPAASFVLPNIVHSEQVVQPSLPHAAPSVKVEAPVSQAAKNLILDAPLALDPFGNSEIIVQKGDTLERLAKKYHTTVDEIIKLNHLPSSFLKVGQNLKIPYEKKLETPRSKLPIPTISEQAEYYTMKVGDNPWSIAMAYHMKVDDLLKLNGLNEKTARKLKPGDRLRIK